MRISGSCAAAIAVGLLAAGTSSAHAAPPEAGALPELTVTPLMEGLSKPWDVVAAPDGTILTGERRGRFVVRDPNGAVREVRADLSDLYAEGETGLMGLALAADFRTSRTLYSCQGHRGPDGTDIRVQSWTVDPGWTELTRGATVLAGIPVGQGGRHGGCRLFAHPDGSLFVGTGDTAHPQVPQDRNSLGGKVLHIDPDGTPAAGNPDPDSPVFTLGHRNVQGLALRPGTGELYAVEQGTVRDDEVNLLQPGGNYGYRPDRFPFVYDESVPMTDPARVPGAIGAVWSSGAPTLATPGGTFVTGAGWQGWDGALVITSQQQEKLLFLELTADGRSVDETATALEGQFGRLRSVTARPDGALLVTTDNGRDDRVLLVEPAAD